MLDPLAEILIPPEVAKLPKADLHLHQEAQARLNQLFARRHGQPPYEWRPWLRQMLTDTAPGFSRLEAIYKPDSTFDLNDSAENAAENFIARTAAILEEAAADGAVLVEVRFGAMEAPPPIELMPLFREAEKRVQQRYPQLHAEAIAYIGLSSDAGKLQQAEKRLEACLQAAQVGLGGVDFSTMPYDTEADPIIWQTIHRLAARAADGGLGITIHTGEFSTGNLAAALKTPGLKRLGHAVYAASDPHLLDQLIRSGVTVECSLTCNVVLGAVRSYETHPIKQFVAAGVPVTLNTDLPVHLATTIGREYAIANLLGFSLEDLGMFTRNAIQASFMSDNHQSTIMRRLSQENII